MTVIFGQFDASLLNKSIILKKTLTDPKLLYDCVGQIYLEKQTILRVHKLSGTTVYTLMSFQTWMLLFFSMGHKIRVYEEFLCDSYPYNDF